jgi:hypothetical protein
MARCVVHTVTALGFGAIVGASVAGSIRPWRIFAATFVVGFVIVVASVPATTVAKLWEPTLLPAPRR